MCSDSLYIQGRKKHMSQAQVYHWPEFQAFLNGRLRTTPYRIAVRHQPLISIPLVPLNTQYLIDGMVMAVADRGDRGGRETYQTLVHHIRSSYNRWQHVVQYILTLNVPSHSSSNSSTPHHATNQPSSQDERRYLYGVMAAMQDVLLAWYVVDAMIKGLPVLHVARQLLLQELPTLLSTTMPLVCMDAATVSRSRYLQLAVAEYQGRWDDIIASWYLAPTMVTIRDAVKKCEEILKRVAQRRTGTTVSHEPQSKSAVVAVPLDAHHSGFSARDDLLSMVRAAMKGHMTTSKTIAVERPVLTGKALVDVFIQQAFERSRQELSCKHCGALFPTAAALASHFPTHYAEYQLRDKDTAVRLRFPSLDDALQHCPYTSPHCGASADEAVTYFCKTTEAHKPGYKATTRVRHSSHASNKLDGGATTTGGVKRPRGVEGVVVVDIAAEYRCVVCGDAVRPVLDTYTRDWVLPHCRRVDAAEGGVGPTSVAHIGCRNA